MSATSLFAYGTLAVPEVIRALVGACPPSRPAALADHFAYRMQGAVYPGLIEVPGRSATGRLYPELDAGAMRLIEAFEEDIYERVELTVQDASGETFPARIYRIPFAARGLLSPDPWDEGLFRTRHLAAFCAMCEQFRHEQRGIADE